MDVRGGAPGTRELALLDPVCMVEKVHAILLGGGSAFGLAAADGVMRWLEEQDHGYNVGIAKVPIVPAAILFDLALGRADVRPDAAAGYAACVAAVSGSVAEGNVGAGTGATVGKLLGFKQATKGGLGMASQQIGRGNCDRGAGGRQCRGRCDRPGDASDPCWRAPARERRLCRFDAGGRKRARPDLASPGAVGRQHNLGRRRYQRRVNQNRRDQSCADGARRPGAHDPPGPHDARRRYCLCALAG